MYIPEIRVHKNSVAKRIVNLSPGKSLTSGYGRHTYIALGPDRFKCGISIEHAGFLDVISFEFTGFKFCGKHCLLTQKYVWQGICPAKIPSTLIVGWNLIQNYKLFLIRP